MGPRESSAPEASRLVPAAQLVLAALWLGAATFLTLSVAPAAFAALPSRELAGALVGRVLPALFWWGAATGLLLLGLQLRDGQARFRRRRMGAAGVLIAACAVAQLGIAPRIATLRGAMAGPPSTLAPSDPQRMAFGRLHMLSVAWLGIAMVASVAAMALPLIILRSRDRT